jgi:hypothetical protein
MLRHLIRVLPALALAGMVTLARGATITIVNLDGAGEGFNDATPAAPTGGNAGTTVGQQRLLVFQQAASIWGGILPSNVQILVNSKFDPLTCTSTSAVLGSAGAVEIFRDFSGAEFSGTWYSKALGDKLAGSDLDAASADIAARFNSSIGNPGCMDGYSWYYGFDHNEGASQIDLLAVVLHELGHGLNFQTFADGSTGALAGGYPDIFAKFLYDQATGLHWDQETDGQRAASAVNTFKLLWDGNATRFMAPHTLQSGRATLRVNAPPAVAGDMAVGTASFGPALASPGVTGAVVLADDGAAPTSDGCTALVNPVQMAGNIALLDRGTCSFAIKVKNAQDAGAIGAIIVNNAAGSPPPGMGGSDPTITIPSVMVTLADGTALKAQLASGLNVTLRTDPVLLAGGDAQGRVMMYTPNPYQPGSSVSHFDVSCTPNLLMEPAINSDLTSSVDLTRYVFEDIGWLPRNTGVPPGEAPALVSLAPNAPNPFSRSTSIGYNLPRAGEADLAVYDVSGRLVKRLFRGPLPAGSHLTVWDGTGNDGRRVPGGVYFAHLRVDEVLRSNRMVMLGR